MAEIMDTEEPICGKDEPNVDSTGCATTDTNQCDPCKIVNKSVIAQKYCDDCEENLCEDCVIDHTKRKATASHQPISIEQEESANNMPCTPCKDNSTMVMSVTYCELCEEYLCNDCTYSHRNRKATKEHKPVEIENLDRRLLTTNEITTLCDPCKEKGGETTSCMYCKECDEYLCDLCTNSHMNRKATKNHPLVHVSEIQNKGNDTDNLERKLCEPCKSINVTKDAKSFCVECEELLCADCTNIHRTKKITKSHALESPDCVQYVIRKCEICETRDRIAAMFCETCEEALCETCGMRHKKQTATKSHNIDPINGKTLEKIIRCDFCIDDFIKAEKRCTECEENLCGDCARIHSKQKKTKEHKLTSTLSSGKREEPQMNQIPFCKDCGKNKRASKYCPDCQSYLCEDCCEIHSRSKFTSKHVLRKPEEVEDKNDPNCDSCKSAGTAESYCEQCGEFFCKICTMQHKRLKETREHQVMSVQDGLQSKTAQHLTTKTVYSRHDVGKSDNRIEHPSTQRMAKRPGKPRSNDVLADTITLSWDPPSTFGDDDYYQISYKDLDHEKKWKFIQEEYKETTAVLRDMKSNTAFIFRVRVVYEDGEGPYSDESEKILTSDSPASRIVKFSVVKEKGNPSPSKYGLPITEIRQARNEKAKTKKFEVGAPPLHIQKSKTIMLVGATGTGKSTLVDGIVNYVLGANWDDPFRFTVIDMEQEEKDRIKNQALSQTEWITCYTLNPEKGSRLKYPLNIIDTPGFGDTRGLKRDQEIVEQIRTLFSEKEPKGVTFIDAVCFLIKAPDARLTAVQSYIFQSIMSLFGKDIEKNICSLVTFADGIDPPVLAALRESGLPFGKSFTFNNSGLFAKNSEISSSSLSPMFWDMGLKSFRAFFQYLDQIETKSLQLTKDVLDERSRLEATVKNLQPQLDAGLSKVNSMKQEIEIIEKNKSLIKDNKNFEYVVDETQQKKKELPRGQHVTNCTHCHFTCHDDCAYANDDEKANCSAMGSDGNCKICPDKCHWTEHANTPYIFEYINVKVKKTYADMQKKYQEATGKLLSQEQIVEKLGEELNELLDDIEDMMDAIKLCNERLEEIALRPNPLTMTEHIDLMIENEKLEKKDGFLQRINILNDFRKKAQISKDAEFFSQEARSALGAAGKKRKRDTKSLMSRFGAWFVNKIS